ncbi:MAG TPA: hypothetical protein VK644_04095 [Chitinophagaceae bacterium]|nr:hypothetical protein [Chitinophagaceae bacterium]
MNSLTKEFEDFMEWFSKTHPDLFEKYARNIDIPFQEGGGVSVNNKYKLSTEEFDMLTKVARSYYSDGKCFAYSGKFKSIGGCKTRT